MRQDAVVTNEYIIDQFTQFKPTTVTQIRALGIDAIDIGSGSTRYAYKLNRDLMVKIPIYGPTDMWQTDREIIVIERINRDPALSHLRRHAPKVHYTDRVNGIIIMKYYPVEMSRDTDPETLCRHRELRRKFERIGVTDLWCGNVREHNNELIAVDLGCFFEPGPEND